jgi:hypothetical protein
MAIVVPMSNSNSYITWLSTLPRAEAELIREADAAVEMAEKCAKRGMPGDVSKAQHWNDLAERLYAERRALADRRTRGNA